MSVLVNPSSTGVPSLGWIEKARGGNGSAKGNFRKIKLHVFTAYKEPVFMGLTRCQGITYRATREK